MEDKTTSRETMVKVAPGELSSRKLKTSLETVIFFCSAFDTNDGQIFNIFKLVNGEGGSEISSTHEERSCKIFYKRNNG